MQSVKVLPKGQITLPKKMRDKFGINIGDALVLEESKDGIVLKKGKTIFDYAGTLPNPGISIEEMIEKATEEVAKESA
ncbi:MAG: AbrB/MazE/SpoVT family DNA-binding domain-containing protein [Nitrospiraceae bacterium]|nr:AbrB/MazE/SpoVT family DNA-binding domain-containing protein [Nitrospiraceae bacterium]